EPAHDLWSDLIDKFPHLRTRFLTVCPCILDSVEKWEMCLNDEVLQWVQSVAEGEEPALAAGAGDEDKPLVLQGKLAHEVEGYLLHPEVGGPLLRNEFVGCGIPMSHPPLRLGAGEEKGPLSPCHHATHVETPVSILRIIVVSRTPLLPALQEVEYLSYGVAAPCAKILAEQPVDVAAGE